MIIFIWDTFYLGARRSSKYAHLGTLCIQLQSTANLSSHGCQPWWNKSLSSKHVGLSLFRTAREVAAAYDKRCSRVWVSFCTTSRHTKSTLGPIKVCTFKKLVWDATGIRACGSLEAFTPLFRLLFSVNGPFCFQTHLGCVMLKKTCEDDNFETFSLNNINYCSVYKLLYIC